MPELLPLLLLLWEHRFLVLVLLGLAQQERLQLVHVVVTKPHFDDETPSDWVLMALDPAILGTPAILRQGTTIQLPGPAPLWTDDYSDLYRILK